MHGIVRLLAGAALDPVSDIANPVSQLMRKTQRFLSSPQVAFVVGQGALLSGPPQLADAWATWIHDCAALVGDEPLLAVAPLTHTMVGLATCRGADIDQVVNAAAAQADRSGLAILAARARAVSGYLVPPATIRTGPWRPRPSCWAKRATSDRCPGSRPR